MTETTGKKKQNQNEYRKKYRPLDKRGTKVQRRDFIETDYVNGVSDPYTGENVIRPLNEEEKAWLSQFILETEHGTFKKNEKLRAAEELLKRYRKDFKVAKKSGNVEEMSRLFKLEEDQYTLVLKLREETDCFYVTDEERSVIFDKDNARRRDVYLDAKMNGNLLMYDLHEYDKFDTERTDLEDKLLGRKK